MLAAFKLRAVPININFLYVEEELAYLLDTADCTVGPRCVSMVAGIKKPLGDKAYDSDSFRKSLKEDGITLVIPGRANRKKPIRHDKKAYKGRNVIERCCRLKDFRRIATRYDKLARNYFSSACLVAAVVYWV